MPDLEAIAAIAKNAAIPFYVDNTMATPLNCQPLHWGADAVIHSTSKYLSGTNTHGGGVVLCNDDTLAQKLIHCQALLNNSISPYEADALLTSLHDFTERMQRFNANGLKLAKFLEKHPAVEKTHYALLESSGTFNTAKRILNGGGGVVSFELKDSSLDAVRRFYDSPMPHVHKAPSLGSDETLMCPYVLLTYYKKDDAYLRMLRLNRHLLRVSCGCEKDFTPILNELDAALTAV